MYTVRSQLEFACVVWNPSYDSYSYRIESIQKQFVQYALRRTIARDINHRLPSYVSRCKTINLPLLSARRDNASVFFVFDLLLGRIDAPNILTLLNFSVPLRRLRVSSLFATSHHRTNYGNNEPVEKMCQLFNSIDFLFDFNVSRQTFRTAIKCRPM